MKIQNIKNKLKANRLVKINNSHLRNIKRKLNVKNIIKSISLIILIALVMFVLNYILLPYNCWLVYKIDDHNLLGMFFFTICLSACFFVYTLFRIILGKFKLKVCLGLLGIALVSLGTSPIAMIAKEGIMKINSFNKLKPIGDYWMDDDCYTETYRLFSKWGMELSMFKGIKGIFTGGKNCVTVSYRNDDKEVLLTVYNNNVIVDKEYLESISSTSSVPKISLYDYIIKKYIWISDYSSYKISNIFVQNMDLSHHSQSDNNENYSSNENKHRSSESYSNKESDSYDNSSKSPSTSNIVIENRRDPVPISRQEWIPCGACQGTGDCHVCWNTGGTESTECLSCRGTRKCSYCNGERGHYETVVDYY